MILCATTLAVLLVIGVKENPGPGVEAEKIMEVLCSASDRILKIKNST
jgi:hypothetical protein